MTLSRDEFEDILREHHKENGRVRLTLDTWAKLVGITVTLLTIGGTVLTFIFQTQNQSLIQHSEIIEYVQMKRDEALEKHTKEPHPVTKDELHRLELEIKNSHE